MTAPAEDLAAQRPLPAWRLAGGVAILGGMISLLLWLAPWYVQDYRFKTYLRDFAAHQDTAVLSDEALQAEIAGAGQRFGLPVVPGNVKVNNARGVRRAETAYAVHLGFIQVDLHFHEGISCAEWRAGLKDNRK